MSSSTRPKVILAGILTLLLTLFGCNTIGANSMEIEQSFSDIHNDFWAKDEVTQLVDLEIINGYPDKQFRPTLEVSRGQAANLLSKAFQLPDTPYRPIFTDVSSKSSHVKGAMTTYEAGIFLGKEDGTFGVGDSLTREQMATVIVRAFKLEDTGEEIKFADQHRISESHREGVKILAQHGITTGKEDGTFDPKTAVNRATYVVFLHRAMVKTGKLTETAPVLFTKAETFGEFTPVRHEQNFVEVPVSKKWKTYLRSNAYLQFAGEKTKKHAHSTDTVYTYNIAGMSPAVVNVTKRQLQNGDHFIFTELRNPQRMPVSVDLIQVEEDVTRGLLRKYDRYPIKKNADGTFGFDMTTYPTGVFEKTLAEGSKAQKMIGKSFRSKELSLKYKNGESSQTRELIDESEAFSGIRLGDTQLSVYTLRSRGYDVVDHWLLASDQLLFSTNERMDDWMHESAIYYKKRNKWYTANGPYNKMATTIEPLPASGQAYGRNLLLVKEDRVMAKYTETEERYYESLLYNSFANLEIFRGIQKYWETEVTSTYLKNLFGITAPFVDTRFNEQIALFLYNGGKAFGHKDYNDGLLNYADLLVSQKNKKNIIKVDATAFYIQDYFPSKQNVKTHASMNHLLGGMNILLLAYKETGKPAYLETANSIQSAIEKDVAKWIRPNGDIWYKMSPDRTLVGEDYVHLTLEDLIHSYEMWKDVDPSKVAVFERMIRSKAGYMNTHKKGYTTKIKNGLDRINMSELLPAGLEYTDAL
ncbi:S-layer homology domain-containing protein [Sporosarcina oncorhynchi]|uniref:S-layer homology domain-containing protein n=1 Tax=Sporosarcina oncorhynchi TaxID=3056444 RepID=A0ABZ0L4G9_9BACL|nr:S-layer homology domain-containing protein [Sporosarcina sp. T2O-4]WOV86818.1 S-layer homology domain-containing protein [Sporosarcina sp. T2O-4]